VLYAALACQDWHACSRAHTHTLASLSTRACMAPCTRHDAQHARHPSQPSTLCHAPKPAHPL
jgi:hypothetical protein